MTIWDLLEKPNVSVRPKPKVTKRKFDQPNQPCLQAITYRFSEPYGSFQGRSDHPTRPDPDIKNPNNIFKPELNACSWFTWTMFGWRVKQNIRRVNENIWQARKTENSLFFCNSSESSDQEYKSIKYPYMFVHLEISRIFVEIIT